MIQKNCWPAGYTGCDVSSECNLFCEGCQFLESDSYKTHADSKKSAHYGEIWQQEKSNMEYKIILVSSIDNARKYFFISTADTNMSLTVEWSKKPELRWMI